MPISTTLGTKNPRVKWFHVCSSKGPVLLQMGDNKKKVKIELGVSKIFFSITTGLITDTKYPWGRAFKSLFKCRASSSSERR